GDIGSACQAKLLRVLQERQVDRVGGCQPIPVDIRVIAATNQNLAARIHDGHFREDLYYRLNVFAIRTPALRDHPDDIPVLVDHFVGRYGSPKSRPVTGVSREVMEMFQEHSWPGNVRQLENVIHAAVIDCDTDTIQIGNLPGDFWLNAESESDCLYGN